MPKAEGFINRMKDGGSLVLCPYLMVKVWIKGQFRVSALLFDFLEGFSFVHWGFFYFIFLSFLTVSCWVFNLRGDKRTQRIKRLTLSSSD